MDQLPRNEGFYPSVTITEKGKITPAALKFPVGSTFEDLCKDYTFFTYAPVVLYGNLNFDPLLQFYNEHPEAARPSVIMTDEPVFTGLETHRETAFNHMLFAVPNEVWKDLAFHLGTIGMRNNEQKIYFETVVQKLPMVDYLALSSGTVFETIPVVYIYGIALDGNKCCLHFKPAENPSKDKISFIRSSPRAAVIKFAETLFQDRPVLERPTDG